MLVLMLWNQWNKKLRQVVVDTYWLWMFWKCLILMQWWYWKLLDMGIISMTFLRNPLIVMSCKFTCFFMNLLKLIKTFIGGCMVTCLFVSIWHLWQIYFYVVNVSINNFEFKTYFFCYNDFHSFVNFKERYKILNFTYEYCLSYNVLDVITYCSFLYVSIMTIMLLFCFDVFECILIM
jgi:hypothetical protein